MGRNVVYYSDELYHHGIKGMKWGVRRYQNPDGSLTAAGRKHRVTGYIETAGSKISGGIRNAGNAVKNKYNSLSDRQKTALKVAGGALLGAAAMYGGVKAYKFASNSPAVKAGINKVKSMASTSAKKLYNMTPNDVANRARIAGADAKLALGRASRSAGLAGAKVAGAVRTTANKLGAKASVAGENFASNIRRKFEPLGSASRIAGADAKLALGRASRSAGLAGAKVAGAVRTTANKLGAKASVAGENFASNTRRKFDRTVGKAFRNASFDTTTGLNVASNRIGTAVRTGLNRAANTSLSDITRNISNRSRMAGSNTKLALGRAARSAGLAGTRVARAARTAANRMGARASVAGENFASNARRNAKRFRNTVGEVAEHIRNRRSK